MRGFRTKLERKFTSNERAKIREKILQGEIPTMTPTEQTKLARKNAKRDASKQLKKLNKLLDAIAPTPEESEE